VSSAQLSPGLKLATRALAGQGYQWRTAVMMDVALLHHGEGKKSITRAATGATVLVWLDERRDRAVTPSGARSGEKTENQDPREPMENPAAVRLTGGSWR
jgi:hypothetical protein